ncbi:MAG TPA: hypothetical protein GXX64_07965 [Bacteroidales bacterium]|nr:hypothetical protein [Bacteroidales bacterium]
MDDKKDIQTKDKQQEERKAHAVALRGWHDRIRQEIEQLVEAYGGNHDEVIEAYRQAEQAANRRARRLERQAIQAKHEWQIANYELRLAKDILEDIQRRQSR